MKKNIIKKNNMKNLYYFFFLSFFYTSFIFANNKINNENNDNKKYSKNESKKNSGYWNWSFNTGYINDDKNNYFGNVFQISSSFKYKLLSNSNNKNNSTNNSTNSTNNNFNFTNFSNLYFIVEPNAKFSVGRAQSFYGEITPSNKIFINEALISWLPFDFLELNLGSINQRRLKNPLLLANIPFPGWYGRYTIHNNNNWNMFLSFEQVAPTSYTLEVESTTKESLTFLTATSFFLLYKNERNFQNEFFITYFDFGRLSTSIAQDSSGLGNDIIANNQFKYPFKGISLGNDIKFPLINNHFFNLGFRYIINQEAQETENDAYLFFSSLSFHKKSFDIIPKISIFKIEEEIAPAYYNTSKYSGNNRQGYSLELEFDFLHLGFKIITEYTNSQVIYIKSDLSRRDSFFIKLETKNEHM